jgi:hypothetical protein
VSFVIKARQAANLTPALEFMQSILFWSPVRKVHPPAMFYPLQGQLKSVGLFVYNMILQCPPAGG